MGVKITMVGANNNGGANNNAMVGANNNGGWGNNCQQESTTFSETAAALHPLNKTLWIHQGNYGDERWWWRKFLGETAAARNMDWYFVSPFSGQHFSLIFYSPQLSYICKHLRHLKPIVAKDRNTRRSFVASASRANISTTLPPSPPSGIFSPSLWYFHLPPHISSHSAWWHPGLPLFSQFFPNFCCQFQGFINLKLQQFST